MAHLFRILITSLVFLMCVHLLNAQNNDWIANNFQSSIFKGVDEINGNYYGIVSSVTNDEPNPKFEFFLYKLDFLNFGGTQFSMEVIDSIFSIEHFTTLAIKHIDLTGVWLLVQAREISPGKQQYRVIICDNEFNIVAERTADALGYPLSFHIDSDDTETYVLGSLLGPPKNELVYLKYSHSKPYELPSIEVRQLEPRDLFDITSMKVDQQTGNMLIFSIDGISVMDSNLLLIKDFNSTEVLTSGHGHLLGIGDSYYSHGARDSSWDVPLRKLVVHKYDGDFNILVADTLGWSGQDNYPFINESIDYRNNEILVGGHLDGPLNHFELDKSIKKFYLAKYDTDLNQIWYKEYGGDRAYLMFGLYLLEDGSCLAYGAVTDTSTGYHYAYIMHVNENGEILTSLTLPQETTPLIQIVNPGNESLVVLNPDCTIAQFELFDMQGHPVLHSELDSYKEEFNTAGLPNGTYPYIFIQNGQIISKGIWVKQKK